jgi:pyruvate dehydrogenase E1 component alpha subunit
MAARARHGDGPALIVAETYRLEGFSTSDMGGYQDPEEVERWRERDPLRVCETALGAMGVEAGRLVALRAEAQARIIAAFEAAEASPLPVFATDARSAPYSQPET